MKKKYLIMFLILQFLLIITNLFNIEKEIFNLDLLLVSKIVVIIFSLLCILLVSKASKNMKILLISLLIFISSVLIFESNSLDKIINYFYYVSTYSFALFYYEENKITKYRFINIIKCILLLTLVYHTLAQTSSFTLEIIINILLPISLMYYNSDKKFSIFILLFSIFVGLSDKMYLIVYNCLIISFIILIHSFVKKERRIESIVILLLVLTSALYYGLFKTSYIYDSFYMFGIDFEIYSIITIGPLIALLLLIIYNITKSRNISLGLILNTYILSLITCFAALSIENIANEFIILIYSYLFVIAVDNIKRINKPLKDEVTIMALHLGYGGIEQFISSLTTMIDKDIKIISTYKLYNKPPFKYDARIEYLMNYGPNKEELKKAIKGSSVINFFKEGFKSIKILYLKKYKNIEAIENVNTKYIITTRDFHNELVGYYSRKDIIKIATEHNYHNNDKKYIRRIINSVNNLDYFVLVAKYLCDYYKDKTKTTCIYIPNVIETLPKTKSNNYGHNLISVGRLSKIKAQEELIELVKILKEDYNDIKLTLIGDGEEKENLEKLITSNNLQDNIVLTGFLNKEEIEKEYTKNNIFITTSKSESFGLVAIEACSYKLPVVAFDTALGLKEILNNCGVLIENRNLKTMKKEIKKLFDNKKYRDEIANKGYENTKQYLSKNIRKNWNELIK